MSAAKVFFPLLFLGSLGSFAYVAYARGDPLVAALFGVFGLGMASFSLTLD
jgi:hypothetical protein